MATRTAWLPRTALSLTIYNEFITGVLPALNANIKFFFNRVDNTFNLKDVFKGDRFDVVEPLICISVQHQSNRGATNDAFWYDFNVSLCLKVPNFGDNTPESFELLGNLFMDTILDYFTNINRFNVVPVNSEGVNTLPGESTFIAVTPIDMYPTLGRDSAGQLNYRKYEVLLNSKFVIGLRRESQL